MEEQVFPTEAVAAVLEPHFIEARLHTDGEVDRERILGLQKELTRSLANPFYVIQDPQSGRILDSHSGPLGAPKFAAFLRESVEAADLRVGDRR